MTAALMTRADVWQAGTAAVLGALLCSACVAKLLTEFVPARQPAHSQDKNAHADHGNAWVAVARGRRD